MVLPEGFEPSSPLRAMDFHTIYYFHSQLY